MAGGGHFAVAGARARDYKGKVTSYVVFACIIAASGGLIFGYDIGISGGVSSMDDFLIKFFPVVYRKKHGQVKENDYCKYNNHKLTAFTSSLYLAGLTATFGASQTTRKYGRRPSILIGGLSFLVGAALNAAAVNMVMLILGRIMLGVGIGFGNQAVPLYLSEMAPAPLRGSLNLMFQLATTMGILAANVINYFTQKLHPWGWRVSLGLAAAPALLMTVGSLFLPETPNSLIERGKVEEGRHVLQRVRGCNDVEAELKDMIEASEVARGVKHPFRNILQRRNRPQLVMATLIPAFQQLTGNNSILFYAPVLFQSLGLGDNASLYSAVLTGLVITLATLVSIATVDRYGRRPLFLQGGLQMLACQTIIGIILSQKFGGERELSKAYSVAVVALMCAFVAAFGWSWGPLGWLVPSEIFPLETRSAGQSITVSVNLLFTFLIAQSFLWLLCQLKYGVFFLFASLLLVMTIFIYIFLPETKGVPIEEMGHVWQAHFFWKHIIQQDNVGKDNDDNLDY